MMHIIQFLEKNPTLITLLEEQKASLIGVSSVEQKAILDAFSGSIDLESESWE